MAVVLRLAERRRERRSGEARGSWAGALALSALTDRVQRGEQVE